jgi:hypothetical protein
LKSKYFIEYYKPKYKYQENLVQNPKKSKTKKADPKLLLRQPLFLFDYFTLAFTSRTAGARFAFTAFE